MSEQTAGRVDELRDGPAAGIPIVASGRQRAWRYRQTRHGEWFAYIIKGMTNQESILRDLLALPPEAQKMVVDYIAYLRLHYTQVLQEETEALPDLQDEPFIGLWRDRADMTDSEAWVCDTRTREWGSRNHEPGLNADYKQGLSQ